jgi:hypothetical protein
MSPHRPNYAESPDQILKRLDYLDLHGASESLSLELSVLLNLKHAFQDKCLRD